MRSWKTAVAFLILGSLAGLLAGNLVSDSSAQQSKPPIMPREITSYRDIVKQVLPAVVSIQAIPKMVSQTSRRGGEDPFGGALDDLPDPAIRRYLEELRRRGGGMDMVPRGGQFGSGVVIDPKGVILTNNHVISGAESAEVLFQDGTRLTSKTIAGDPKTDLAVIKVEAKKPLAYAELGDSDAMEIGDRVLAIGAPFGLAGTVTHGIISGKKRNVNINVFEDFLQTDAAINPGNSGGPLVNLEGRVIGISTAIKSQNGGFQGVGLAIPSNMAREIAAQLVRDGGVRRGYLGVLCEPLHPEVAARLNITEGKGVIIDEIYPETPAAKAGLKEGDVILTINGKPVEDSQAMQRIIFSAPINQTVEMGVVRGDGKRESIKALIEQQPDDYGFRQPTLARRGGRPRAGAGPESLAIDKLGLEVADLTREMAEQLGQREAKGAMITAVEPGSLAQLAGLRRGMVITQAEKKPVETAKDLQEILSKASLDQGVLLLVRTPQGGSRYVVLKASGG